MSHKSNSIPVARVDVFSDIPRTVLLVGGPYHGQDIRASAAELQNGVLVRGADTYVASQTHEPPLKSRLPLFLWLQKAKAMLFPLMTMPCGI